MSPFSHSEWDKVCDLCLNCPVGRKKLQMSKHITEEQRYAISHDVANTDEQKAIAGSYRRDKRRGENKGAFDARSGSYSMELPSEKQTGASSKNIARKCLHRQ